MLQLTQEEWGTHSLSPTNASTCAVVVNWNGKSATLECLDSLAQSSAPCGVVLVDNGSSDGSVEIIRERFPDVLLLEMSRNLGYAEGNNVGVTEALRLGAERVFVVNNDVIVERDTLRSLSRVLEADERTAIVSPLVFYAAQPDKLWFSDARWSRSACSFQHNLHSNAICGNSSDIASDTPFVAGCAMLMRREAILEVGLLDERFFLTWEEVDWCYRIRQAGWAVKLAPVAKVLHHVSASFEGGWAGPQYQYYYTRNQALWIEKNLQGVERVECLVRCLGFALWTFLRLLRNALSGRQDQVVRMRALGAWHYLTRRFGPL